MFYTKSQVEDEGFPAIYFVAFEQFHGVFEVILLGYQFQFRKRLDQLRKRLDQLRKLSF